MLNRENPDTTIKIGDRVKSYDFPDSPQAEGCYVIGTVVALPVMDGCTRYKIAVEKRVFNFFPSEGKDFVYPPVNGTQSWGCPTFGVEKLEPITLTLVDGYDEYLISVGEMVNEAREISSL